MPRVKAEWTLFLKCACGAPSCYWEWKQHRTRMEGFVALETRVRERSKRSGKISKRDIYKSFPKEKTGLLEYE